MTSQRTRERLVQRLRSQGISNTLVLDVMRNTPRHMFVDEALARLVLPPVAEPSVSSFTLHPSLIDGALQTALLLVADSEGLALPFLIDRVRFVAPTTETCYAHVQAHEQVPH